MAGHWELGDAEVVSVCLADAVKAKQRVKGKQRELVIAHAVSSIPQTW